MKIRILICIIVVALSLSGCYFSHHTGKFLRKKGYSLCEIPELESLELITARKQGENIVLSFFHPGQKQIYRVPFALFSQKRDQTHNRLKPVDQADTQGEEIPFISYEQFLVLNEGLPGSSTPELVIVRLPRNNNPGPVEKYFLVQQGKFYELGFYSPLDCNSRRLFNIATAPILTITVIADILSLPVRVPLGLSETGM